MTWRITGVERLDGVDLDAGRPRRHADVAWDDGLAAMPGSEWALEQLRAIDGKTITLGASAVTPAITVNLADEASAFWATTSLLWDYDVHGTEPEPTWVDDTPAGAIN